MSIASGGLSYTSFLRAKWVVLVLLVLLFAYFATAPAGGVTHLNLAKWLLLSAVGVGNALIFMFLWFRLGRAGWYIVLAQIAIQVIWRGISAL